MHYQGSQHWAVGLLGQCKFSLKLKVKDAMDESPFKKTKLGLP